MVAGDRGRRAGARLAARARPGPARPDAARRLRLRRLPRASPRLSDVPDHHADRARRRGRPRRRLGARAPTTTWSSRSAPARWSPASAPCCAADSAARGREAGRSRSAADGDPAGTRTHTRRRAARAGAQGVRAAVALMAYAGTVVTRERLIDEVWDTNWFGSTKTLDVHVSACAEARRRPLQSALHPHRPRRRLPLLGAVGSAGEPVSLRVRLLAAFAYALLALLIALLVPLRSTCRAGWTPRSRPRRRAGLAAGDLGRQRSTARTGFATGRRPSGRWQAA